MSELKEKDFKKIHDVLKNFNFVQAHEILKFIHDNYKDDWDGVSEPAIPFVTTCSNVPSADELEKIAWEILTDCIKDDLQYCETGFLRAEKITFTDYPDDYELGLYFVPISYFKEAEESEENNEENH